MFDPALETVVAVFIRRPVVRDGFSMGLGRCSSANRNSGAKTWMYIVGFIVDSASILNFIASDQQVDT